MKTFPDSADTWFLDQLQYGDGRLGVVIAEDIAGENPETVSVGGALIPDVFPVEATAQSRHVLVIFDRLLAYSVTNESYSSTDDTGDDGKLRRCQCSRFAAFVNQNTLVKQLVTDEWFHYRLILADEILDVASLRDVPRHAPWPRRGSPL